MVGTIPLSDTFNQTGDETMKIKKTANKAFHNGNRLNGNGAHNHATYKVYSNDGVEVGFANRSSFGDWTAYAGVPLKPILRSCRTLAELKALLAAN